MLRSSLNNQLILFPTTGNDSETRPSIVNVASVPQRSPFRYPGGKTWLAPKIRDWLKSLPEKPREFIEPFAGGGIISLTVAFERLADHVTMIEMDDEVAAVWKVIIEGDAEILAENILTFDIKLDTVVEELSRQTKNIYEKAFRTILRNRVNHGGILAHGSGLIKNGENGKGVASRWYPKTIARRIREITLVRDGIRFIEGDGMEYLKRNINKEGAVFFLDPPYTASGKKAGMRLYKHNRLNHDELFKTAKNIKGDFLMTYDMADGVIELAKKYNFKTCPIPMKNTHHAEMMELLIGRNLDWLK